MVFDFTTKSFRILLNAVPRWMRPLAYGGPSCSTYVGRPARDARIWWYSFSFSHRSSIFGSACGRLAFMEKAVFGRLMVCFRSTFCESIGGVNTMLPSEQARPMACPRPDTASRKRTTGRDEITLQAKTVARGAKVAAICAKMLSSTDGQSEGQTVPRAGVRRPGRRPRSAAAAAQRAGLAGRGRGFPRSADAQDPCAEIFDLILVDLNYTRDTTSGAGRHGPAGQPRSAGQYAPRSW